MSLSLSPAFGPWGIPFELVDEVAGAGAALEDVDFDEDEPPPQPATAIAATAIRSAIQRRAVMELIVVLLPVITIRTMRAGDSFPVYPDGQSAIPSPHPPSITISCPVMYSEAGDARNSASALMSSGWPTRCMGMSLASAACTSGR